MVRSWKTVGLALAILFAAWFAFGADGVLTNADILRLTKAGVGESAIIAMIASSATDFDTSVDSVVELAEAGVGDAVVTAMVAARSASGRTTARPPPGPAGTPAAGRGGIGPELRGAVQPRAIPGSTFREALSSGGEGPEMVVIPAGRFRMGCLSNDDDCVDREKPVHEVAIAQPFALSVHEVTFEDYDRFTYPNRVADDGWGRGRRPAINVSWDDAQDYVQWLSAQTGGTYRLPSEAEWEYAARAGTTTNYHWGDEIGANRAHCYSCGSQWSADQTAPAGSFAPNRFGLYDMHGNVREWVADCSNASYRGAPSDAGPWLGDDCTERVLRGGSWFSYPRNLRAANRYWYATGVRVSIVGFRVARTLTP